MRAKPGMSLMEIVIASLLAALVAGGTMIAFVMAMGIARQGSADESEAVFYVQQTLERNRNRIACDDAWFSGSPDCTSAGQGTTADLIPPAPNGVTSSLLQSSATRDYSVVPVDCDGDGTPGDCYKVTARVQWTPAQ